MDIKWSAIYNLPSPSGRSLVELSRVFVYVRFIMPSFAPIRCLHDIIFLDYIAGSGAVRFGGMDGEAIDWVNTLPGSFTVSAVTT